MPQCPTKESEGLASKSKTGQRWVMREKAVVRVKVNQEKEKKNIFNENRFIRKMVST